MKDRSDFWLRPQTLPDRFMKGLLYSVGMTREQIQRPFVAVVNTWNEMHPGHFHLNRLAAKVKEGVLMGGGMPFEFNTISVCDGLALGEGMRYVLPTRDVIADSVELVVQAHRYDAMVLIGSCDKILPGLLMAAARVNIPSIAVASGPRFPGYWPRYDLSFAVTQLPEIGKRYQAGEFSEEQLDEMETQVMPCAGACWGMGTANTMACLSEAIGMSLPRDATAHATTAHKERLAVEAGVAVMKMLERKLVPSDIMTENAFDNMLKVNAAIGGSLNTVLHIPAIAHELGMRIELEKFDTVSRNVPLLCSVEPSGPHFMSDLENAGGIPGVMKRLESRLHLDCLTVTGQNLGENIKKTEVFNDEVIRPLDRPVHPYGDIAVLKGNLAPKGAVIRQIAVVEALWKFEGPTRVYNSEEEAARGLQSHEIQAGDVIVIRYEGPKGGPGMREMTLFRFVLAATGFHDSVYLITDGRFSGYTSGPCIGYLSPEAADGGPIALIRDGDMISIDIKSRALNVSLSDDELGERLREWKPPAPRIVKGYLSRYSKAAGSAAEGAILRGTL